MNERYPRLSSDRYPDLDRLLAALPPDEADRLREVWTLAASAAPDDVLDAESAARSEGVLAALADGHDAAPSPRAPRRRDDRPAARPRRPVRRFVGWGASLAAMVAVAVVLWTGRPVTHAAPVGEHLVVGLPDGSAVTLNSGSTLRHNRFSGGARTVRLEGEAFFDVAEAEAPFVVETFDAAVTVLGTRFGVRAWPGEDEAATTVALVSGRVLLAPAADPDAAVVLTPGQRGRVAGSAAPAIEAGGVSDALAWRTGDLVYKDSPLGVILADVERRFGVGVVPSPPTLAQRRVSVALRAPASAEAVVRDLAAALGLRYRARADGFELYAPGITL